MANQLTDPSGAASKKETVKMAGAAKPAVASRKDGPGPIQRISRYLQEVRVELKKTTWPSKADLISSTKVVLGTVIVVGVYVWLIDLLLGTVTAPLFSR
jgi:preprotein translocase subunit SecE